MLRANVLFLIPHGVVSVNVFPFRSSSVCRWRQFSARALAALFCALLVPAAHAQPTIPLAELSAQAEAATVNLRAIAAGAASNDVLAAIERELPPLTRELDARLREHARILSQRPSLQLLRNLELAWQTVRNTVATWTGELEVRIAAFDRDLARLDELEKIWKESLALAQKEQAPAELTTRVQQLLASIARTRSAVESQQALALRLQS